MTGRWVGLGLLLYSLSCASSGVAIPSPSQWAEVAVLIMYHALLPKFSGWRETLVLMTLVICPPCLWALPF